MESQTKTYLLLAVWHSCSVQYPSHFPPHTSKCQHRYPDVNVLPAFDDVTPMKWHRAAASRNSRKKMREPEKHRVKYTNTQNTRAFAGNNDDNETKLYSRVAFFFLLSSFPFVRLHELLHIALAILALRCCAVFEATHCIHKYGKLQQPNRCVRKVVKMDSLM